MKLFVFISFLIGLAITSSAQDHIFKLYDKSGNQVSYHQMMSATLESNMVFFGEYHDQPICHWLQNRLTHDYFESKGESLLIGMEMFETDNQILIDEYFNGLISQKKFESDARLWPNYKSDYKYILEFARTNGITLLGTNVPGRYANSVFLQGIEVLDKLPKEAQSFFPPLPLDIDLTIPSYARLMNMGGGGHNGGNPNFPNAQALRDITMAWSILRFKKDDSFVFHLNGAYHSDDYEGIVHFINKMAPGYAISTISTVYQSDINTLLDENKNKADFILVIDETMTKSN